MRLADLYTFSVTILTRRALLRPFNTIVTPTYTYVYNGDETAMLLEAVLVLFVEGFLRLNALALLQSSHQTQHELARHDLYTSTNTCKVVRNHTHMRTDRQLAPGVTHTKTKKQTPIHRTLSYIQSVKASMCVSAHIVTHVHPSHHTSPQTWTQRQIQTCTYPRRRPSCRLRRVCSRPPPSLQHAGDLRTCKQNQAGAPPAPAPSENGGTG